MPRKQIYSDTASEDEAQKSDESSEIDDEGILSDIPSTTNTNMNLAHNT